MTRTGPGQQSPQQKPTNYELQEVPISNPAELAAYNDTGDTGEPVDEAETAFVDLGYDVHTNDHTDGDEFGSDSGDDAQVHLDAA